MKKKEPLKPASPGKKAFHKHVERAIAHNGKVEEDKRRHVHVTYQKLNGRTVKRKVTPYAMKGNVLVGFDHKRKETRSYRMERVKHMEKAAGVKLEDHKRYSTDHIIDAAENPKQLKAYEGQARGMLKAIHSKLRDNKHRLSPDGHKALKAHDTGKVDVYEGHWHPRFLKKAGVMDALRQVAKTPAGRGAIVGGVSGGIGNAVMAPKGSTMKQGVKGAVAGAASGAAAAHVLHKLGSAFWDSFEKQGSAFAHSAELAGLGILARPALHRMRTGEELSEKSKAVHEVAGLGVLAVPSALAAAHAAPGAARAARAGASAAGPGLRNAARGAWQGVKAFHGAVHA